MDSQKSKRPAILELHNLGKSVKEITRALSVTKWSVYRTLKRFKWDRYDSWQARSGRPRSVRTKQLKKSVRERIKFNPKWSVQKIAKEYNISTRTFRNLYDLSPNSWLSNLLIVLVEILYSFAIFWTLHLGLNLILSLTDFFNCFVRTDRGRPDLGLSTVIPVSFEPFKCSIHTPFSNWQGSCYLFYTLPQIV